jgi:plastocyanin
MNGSQRLIGVGATLLNVCVLLSGCGGGAGATPTVRYLPSQPDATGATTDTIAAPGAATEVATGGIGTLRGRVVYQGDPPNLPPLYAKGAAPKDPEVCGAEAAPNQSIVVNNGGLANVFIYLAKAPAGEIPAAPSEPAIFDQKYCVFKPHALLVRTGQTVKVLNDDNVLHNTHTYPKRNTGFNKGVAQNDRDGVDLVYSRPEAQPLQVGCDVHPWMIAWHLPLDHPFAAVSSDDGTFEIKDLPSGKHQFKVWHEKGGELEKALAVVIKPGETTEIEIPVPAAKLSQFQGPAAKSIQLSFNR